MVLIDGACAAYLERGGRTLLTFNAFSAVDEPDAWVTALVEAHKEGRLGRLQIERIDDEPAPRRDTLPCTRAAGFADGYKGLTLHAVERSLSRFSLSRFRSSARQPASRINAPLDDFAAMPCRPVSFTW